MLTISDSASFLFIHVPKAAGTSVAKALAMHSSRDDWRVSNHNHDTLEGFLSANADKLLGRYGPDRDLWLADYYSFCFVRNPWDRFVSFYAYLKKAQSGRIPQVAALEDFNALLRALDRGDDWLMRLHGVRPQTDFYTLDGKTAAVDRVGRFERLHEDFGDICALIGIKNDLPHANASDHAAYTTLYDDWGRGLIAERYGDEISALGYRFAS